MRLRSSGARSKALCRTPSGGVLPGATVAALEPRAGRVGLHDHRRDRHVPFSRARPGYYDVTASLSAFAPLKFEGVEVLLGQVKTTCVRARTCWSRLRRSASRHPRRSSTCARARAVFSLRQDTIDLLPKGRDFTTLVSQAPGANQEPKLGGISIDGSSASENRFVVNGIETTNLFTGVSGHGVLPEFVDEIQVKSSGYAAEYGGSTGGVINVVTKSGTNQWRGDVLVNFEGDALDGGRRPTLRRVPTDSTRAEYVTYPEDTYTRVEPGVAIGGPLKRDRAWIFVGLPAGA